MLEAEPSVRLSIPWEAIEGMVKGISALDIHQMTVQDLEEAERFILYYGYDYQDPDDRQELTNILQEALSFIERRFLDPDVPWQDLGEDVLNLSIPECFVQEEDPRRLLLYATIGSGLEQRWACAILKVMHIICHINNALLYRNYEQAKQQILSRYQSILSHSDEGRLVLGTDLDGLRLSIAGFEIKDEKSRDSMIMKLLCKRENVAEEVFDMIGVRIITHTPAEAIMALEVLRRNKVIIFPNIIPSRSRNTLVDFDDFRVQYQDVVESYEWGQASLKDVLGQITAIAAETENESFNPANISTLATYRSIHVTERQLIRVKEPGMARETRFFFPYELQIVDEASYLENLSGSSAHTLYKQNQLIQARRRVLGPLFITLRKMNRRHATPNLEAEPTA